MARRAGSLALAIGIVAVSLLGMLVGVLWGFSLKCDDSCGTPPPWRDDPDAWQWNAIGFLAIAGLACALAFFASVALRWKIAAFVALVAWAVVAGVFIDLFRDSGLTSHAERGWAALVVLVTTGLVAIGLVPRHGRPA